MPPMSPPVRCRMADSAAGARLHVYQARTRRAPMEYMQYATAAREDLTAAGVVRSWRPLSYISLTVPLEDTHLH